METKLFEPGGSHPGSSPDCDHCVLFSVVVGKTLEFYSASPHQGVHVKTISW